VVPGLECLAELSLLLYFGLIGRLQGGVLYHSLYSSIAKLGSFGYMLVRSAETHSCKARQCLYNGVPDSPPLATSTFPPIRFPHHRTLFLPRGGNPLGGMLMVIGGKVRTSILGKNVLRKFLQRMNYCVILKLALEFLTGLFRLE